jgi:hypothetical protein
VLANAAMTRLGLAHNGMRSAESLDAEAAQRSTVGRVEEERSSKEGSL